MNLKKNQKTKAADGKKKYLTRVKQGWVNITQKKVKKPPKARKNNMGEIEFALKQEIETLKRTNEKCLKRKRQKNLFIREKEIKQLKQR